MSSMKNTNGLKGKMRPSGKSVESASISDSFKNAAEVEEVLQPLNARVPASLKTKVKMYCVKNDVKMQDLVTLALREYLENHQ